MLSIEETLKDNEKYQEWKSAFEGEMEIHRKANCTLIYRHQRGYSYYENSPHWVMVGDFCNFVRRTKLHEGERISLKYERMMLEEGNEDIFRGFCLAEFKRIKCDRFLFHYSQIFKLHGFKVRLEDLSRRQYHIYCQCITEFQKKEWKSIMLWKRFHNWRDNLYS